MKPPSDCHSLRRKEKSLILLPAPHPLRFIRLPYCSHFHIASLPQKTLKSPPPKNTIRDRDGDSTVLYAAYTVDTVDTVDRIYTVDMP